MLRTFAALRNLLRNPMCFHLLNRAELMFFTWVCELSMTILTSKWTILDKKKKKRNTVSFRQG